MIQGAKSASKVDRFAARQKQRALAVLQRTGNDRAAANAGADIPVANNVSGLLPALAKILYHLENNVDCFLSMLSVYNWKSKKRDHAFPVGGVQVSAFLDQMCSGLANKFC